MPVRPEIGQIAQIVEAVLQQIATTEVVLFERVIEAYRKNEMPTRHSTRTAYESMLRKWIEPRWSSVAVGAIRTKDVEEWLQAMPCSPKTRTHRKALMHSLFAAAVRWEMASGNPITPVRVRGASKRRRRTVPITIEEFRAVLGHLRRPYREMVLVAGTLGLRASEVMGLKWGDFDWDKRAVLISRAAVSARVDDTKTAESEEYLPIPDQLAAQLLAYRPADWQADGWVFPSPRTGKPFHQDSVQARHLRRAGAAAGLKHQLGWKTFRHSYRRWLDEAGTPVGLIKELMRHAHIATTMDVYGNGRITEAKRDRHAQVVGKLLE